MVKYELYGYDDYGYYKRVFYNEADVAKIVKTGTVEQVVKITMTETRWNGDSRTDYTVPTDWRDDA